MPTIKDVADRAGVSVGTASRVLSGSSSTSPDSRERVTAAAAELNYVANGPARSLRRARTDVLGLLVSDIRNPFFAELAHAAEREAMRRGYTILLANANEDEHQADEYLSIFAAQRVDGLLFSPQGPVSPKLASLVSSGFPMVLLNRTAPGLDIPLYATDNAQGVRLVLDWLRDRGHRDVAFVGGPAAMSTGAERQAAYLAGRADHGITENDAFLDVGNFLADGGEAAMIRILDRGVIPTAVFGVNGPTTMGMVRGLHHRLGSAAAAKIAVVSFDDLDWFEFATPPITALRHDAASIGRLGVQGLLNLIEGLPATSARVPLTLVDRS
ncbi:LacI family transcriptional regulator [Mycetocola tolaasinivorans]|uniref:LacI family transcriptional regulator n=1 Tax=Mycetocola tolaasinivorans TaxID=76635 RepID=A0A3L7A2H4_9MICO|nr:LacI family DNA-binding transcriptional regulator [Mycetocola tolaasinivorans]RLP74496.1 LacI family transcriptional regulator [Mycetocola tolaasinivorans]